MRKKDNAAHKIISKYTIGNIWPDGEHKIIVVLTPSDQYLTKIVGSDCVGAYLYFKPSQSNENLIGALCFSTKSITNTVVIHEITHAAIDFNRRCPNQLILYKSYNRCRKELKEEERLCCIMEILTDSFEKLISLYEKGDHVLESDVEVSWRRRVASSSWTKKV